MEPVLVALELLHQARRRVRARREGARPPDPPEGGRRGTCPRWASRSEPGIAPRRSAGISPARTTDDLPLPLGPTTARKRVSPSRSSSCSTSASRPKKSAASASSNARRPL